MPLEALDSGWNNALFRLGPDRAVRLPRRAAAVDLLAKETRWVGELAPRLPLALPVPGQAADGPRNPVRGCPLQDRASAVEGRMARMTGRLEWPEAAVRQLWTEALTSEPHAVDVWIHGDLHPRNLLVREGRLPGAIDWGDRGIGDPATDLASFFLLGLPPHEWEAFERAHGPVGTDTLRRSCGWAVALGLLFLETGSAHDPRYAEIGS